MSRPAQAERPAPGCGEVDVRRTWTLGKFSYRNLAGAIERSPDRERSTWMYGNPGDPQDLIRPVSKRRRVQWVAIGPENSGNVCPCTHHIRHRQRWWMEAGAGPGGKRARGYRGRAAPCRRWRTRCVTGGTPGSCHYRQQDQRCAPPHINDRTPLRHRLRESRHCGFCPAACRGGLRPGRWMRRGRRRKDRPRRRGEATAHGLPRARGRQQALEDRLVVRRTTPASAGTTARVGRSMTPTRDNPRTRRDRRREGPRTGPACGPGLAVRRTTGRCSATGPRWRR
jgi:hypothetical protein